MTEDITDDDLYDALIEFLGCYGIATETDLGVIRLDIADDMYQTGREPGQPLLVHLTRRQLRRLAWAEENIFDDTDEPVVPATTEHVAVGFDTLTFFIEQLFESGIDDDAGVGPAISPTTRPATPCATSDLRGPVRADTVSPADPSREDPLMTKRLTHELIYDAPLDAVSAMLFDPTFREEVCEEIRVISADVTVREVNGATEVSIDQIQEAAGIPSFAKKFVGDQINVLQQERWATKDRGSIDVSIPGKPGDMRGTATLTESGGVTTESVDMEIKVSIPIVGGKIEGLISDLLLKALKAENKVGRAYLSR